jgi:hypothetical protein
MSELTVRLRGNNIDQVIGLNEPRTVVFDGASFPFRNVHPIEWRTRRCKREWRWGWPRKPRRTPIAKVTGFELLADGRQIACGPLDVPATVVPDDTFRLPPRDFKWEPAGPFSQMGEIGTGAELPSGMLTTGRG